MAKYRKKPVVIEAEQWVGNKKEMPIPPAPHRYLRESHCVLTKTPPERGQIGNGSFFSFWSAA